MYQEIFVNILSQAFMQTHIRKAFFCFNHKHIYGYEAPITELPFNPIQDGMVGVQKTPLTNFSFATSINVGISSKTFLLLVSTIFPNWCKISRP